MHPKALRPRRRCDRGVPYTAAWRADDYGRGSAAPGYGWPHPASEAVRALDCRSSWNRSERLEAARAPAPDEPRAWDRGQHQLLQLLRPASVGCRGDRASADRPERASARGQWRPPPIKGAAAVRPAARSSRCSDSSNSQSERATRRGAGNGSFLLRSSSLALRSCPSSVAGAVETFADLPACGRRQERSADSPPLSSLS
jgi:hypothetical protein